MCQEFACENLVQSMTYVSCDPVFATPIGPFVGARFRLHPRCDVTGSLLEMAGPLTGNVRIIDRPEVLILFVTMLCHKKTPACRCLKASADVAFVSFIRPHFASRFPTVCSEFYAGSILYKYICILATSYACVG
ncbi:hypothetical protein NP493_735g01036 [Ridgeia piscesae]|uniref:Uncharacterized protein n=1 Tax=Ridgeia piscesae TaxID=27915 RepID=A0AAD9KRH8_RIDPI|nr:hypothetical protein NP493_735g01036 [Ridgeia piscesae]